MLTACYTFPMHPKSALGLCAAICFLHVTPMAQSQSPTASPPATAAELTLLRQFEAKYRHASRLQVNFLERYSENGRLVRTEAGRAYFLRPGKMRWDYESPEKNTFLVDGKFVWFYSPADHTATRMPTKQ